MNLSGSGLQFIKNEEGFEPRTYPDAGGYPTIGYGHKLRAGESYPNGISQEKALQLLSQDVAGAVSAVNSSVSVPLTQSMFDSLVSLVFNWGAGNWFASSHLRFLNSGDYQRTADRIEEHPITSGGVVVQNLIDRRRREKALFLSQGIPNGARSEPGQIQASAFPGISPPIAPAPVSPSILAGVSIPIIIGALILGFLLTDS